MTIGNIFFFSRKLALTFHANFLCKLSPTIYTKNQSLFSGKSKKNIVSLSSAEFAQRVVKVKNGILSRAMICPYMIADQSSLCFTYGHIGPDMVIIIPLQTKFGEGIYRSYKISQSTGLSNP